jgi:hypothetical protein
VPSIIPSHLYMFVAMTIVGTLLIFSFNSYAATLRSIPETEQLDNLLSYVTAKATELLTLTKTNSNTRIYLNLPTKIGDQQYWIRLHNDTIQSWLEGGFGNHWNTSTSHKVYLPEKPSANGHYVSSFGAAVLKCYTDGLGLQLFLTSARDED